MERHDIVFYWYAAFLWFIIGWILFAVGEQVPTLATLLIP